MTTEDIESEGSWSEPTYFDVCGFDQDFFWDDDEKGYLSWTMRVADRDPLSNLKDFAVHVAQVDLSTGRTLSAPVCVRKSPRGVAEGSHLFKRGMY